MLIFSFSLGVWWDSLFSIKKKPSLCMLLLEASLSKFTQSPSLVNDHLVPYIVNFSIFFVSGHLLSFAEYSSFCICIYVKLPLSTVFINLFLWQYAFPINYAKLCWFLFNKKHLFRHRPNIGEISQVIYTDNNQVE